MVEFGHYSAVATGMFLLADSWFESHKSAECHSSIFGCFVLFCGYKHEICVSLRVSNTCMRQQPSPLALTKRPVGILGI